MNIKNKDNEGFKHCLYAHFETNNYRYEFNGRKREVIQDKASTGSRKSQFIDHPERVSNYQQL